MFFSTCCFHHVFDRFMLFRPEWSVFYLQHADFDLLGSNFDVVVSRSHVLLNILIGSHVV